MNAEQKKFYLTLGLCVTLFSFMACSKGDVAGSEEILPSDIPLTSLQIPPCSRSTVSAWTLNSEDSVYLSQRILPLLASVYGLPLGN